MSPPLSISATPRRSAHFTEVMVKTIRRVAGILLFAVLAENAMRIRIILTLFLGILKTYSVTANFCSDESVQFCKTYEMETERDFTYTLKQINLTTTLQSFIIEVAKAQEEVVIPKTEGCSTACRKFTRNCDIDEIVCNATDGGASFSVNYVESGEPLDEAMDSHLVCSKTEAGHDHSEIKCDAAQGGNSVSVTIDLQPPAVLQCNIYYVIDFGVFVTCSSSLFTIDGIAYFINGKPIGVVYDSQLHISWDAFSSSSSKLSLSVSVSKGELYHIYYVVKIPSGCDEVDISEYRDLGDKIVLTFKPTGNTMEIVSMTILKDHTKIINDNSGGEMSIPKALLNSEEDNFTVLFTVMCGGREFLLVRQLTVTLSPECHANCTASLCGRNVHVVCQGSSEIKSITYSINGETKEVEASEFEIVDYQTPSSDQPFIIVNTITCVNGGKTVIKIGCYELDLECLVTSSPCTQQDGVTINCTSNVPASSLTMHCSIDYVTLQECDLNNYLNYSALLNDGQHIFSIRVTDPFLDNAENQVLFSVVFKIWCTAVYESQQDSITIFCDSTRPIVSSVLQIKGGADMECSLPCTISMTENMSPTEDITITVKAQDHFGNLATHDNLYFLKTVN